MAGIGDRGRELPPGIVYLRGLIRGNARFLVLAAALAALAAAGYEAWKAPRFQQSGLIHMSDGVRRAVGDSLVTEAASLAKSPIGPVGSARGDDISARVETYGGRAIVEVKVRGRSEAVVSERIAAILERLNDRYREKIDSWRLAGEARRTRILEEISATEKEIEEIREEAALLRPLVRLSSDLAVAFAEVGKRLSAKQGRRDDLRAAIDLLDETARNEKGFEFISSSASPLSLSPVRLVKKLLTASLFAAALVMCFLIVRDIWRSGTT